MPEPKVFSFRAKFFLALTFSFLLLGLGFNALATGLTISPVKVSHVIKPGETVNGTITLTNASDDKIIVEVNLNDFVPSAGGEGIQFISRAPGVTTVKDWITIGGQQTFEFKKNEIKAIPYKIKAPLAAEPGGHFGVAFFKASKPTETGQIQVSAQVGVLIFVTVPGNHLQKGKIINFRTPKFIQTGPVSFKIRFANTGTVHFEPRGAIKITNIFGKEVGQAPIEGQVVLPTGEKDLNMVWDPKGLLLGRYKAAANIVDGEGNVLTTDTLTFYALPLWYVLGFVAVMAILFFAIKFLRSRISISIKTK